MAEDHPEIFELSIARHIAAPPETVWEVMTERITQWWCPKPWRTEVVEQNWTAGGRNAFVLSGPDGEEEISEGIFLEVTPGKRFVITDAVTADHKPQGPFMIGIWEIESTEGGTRYTATARHWSKEDYNQHKEMGFEDGWKTCADQLAKICEDGVRR